MRREPDFEPVLRERSSVWGEAHGDIDAAIRSAHANGDIDRFAALVWSTAATHLGSGRSGQIAGWLRLATPEQITAHAALTLAASWLDQFRGYPDEAGRPAPASVGHSPGELLPDGTPTRSAALLLRAISCRDGIGQMLDDATQSYDLDGDDSLWRAVACAARGAALRLLGDADLAQAALDEGFDRAAIRMPAIAALCLTQTAWLAMDDGAWGTAGSYTIRARAMVERRCLGEAPAGCVAYATSALLAARSGDLPLARWWVNRSGQTIDTLASTIPSIAIESRLLLSRASLLLGDPALARTCVRQAEMIVSRIRTPGVLATMVHDVGALVEGATGEECSSACPAIPSMRLRKQLSSSTRTNNAEDG